MSVRFARESAASSGRRANALSYGPFSYIAAALVGFLIGSIGFLIVDASANTHDVVQELPLLLDCAAGGAALCLVGALAANYVIGRRIREQLELQRAMFADGALPPMMPRPDVPGIMLQPAAAYAQSRKQAARSELTN